MEFQEIISTGKIQIQKLSTLTANSSANEGCLAYTEDTQKFYYGDEDSWIEVNDASTLSAHISATAAHGTTGAILGSEHKTDSSGHPLATPSAAGFLKTLSNNSNQYMNGEGDWATVTIPDGDGTKRTIDMESHGFSAGNLLYLDGTTYKKAIATSAVTAEVVGMISIVNSVDQFVLTTSGYVSGGIGALTAGQVYFLSDTTSGAMTPTEPTTDGYVSKPIFIACSTTEGYLINWRGIIVSTGTSSSLPIGTVITWPSESVPEGFLECNGSGLSTETYATLFAHIGYKYGGSAGTFNLPDYRGYFLRGWDNGAGIDPNVASRTNRGDGTVGDNIGTKGNDAMILAETQIPTHSHTYTYTAPGDGGGYYNTSTSAIGSGLSHYHASDINVMYCIKY